MTKETEVLDISDITAGESKTREEYDIDAGEVDLYQEVTDALKAADCPNYENWDKGRIPHDALVQRPMSQQREVINRALRLKLGEYSHDTRDHRYLLIDEGSKEDWSNNIKPVINHIAKTEQALIKEDKPHEQEK